jgi:hypothetical protein
MRRVLLSALLPFAASFGIQEVYPMGQDRDSRLVVVLTEFPRSATLDEVEVLFGGLVAKPLKLMHQESCSRLVAQSMGVDMDGHEVAVKYGGESIVSSWSEEPAPIEIMEPVVFHGTITGDTEFNVDVSHWPDDTSSDHTFKATFGSRSGKVVSVTTNEDTKAVRFVLLPPAASVVGPVELTLSSPRAKISTKFLYTNPSLRMAFSKSGPKGLLIGDMPIKFAVADFPVVPDVEHVLVHFGGQKVDVQSAVTQNYDHNRTQTWLTMLPSLPTQSIIAKHMISGKDIAVPVTITPIMSSSTNEVAAPNLARTASFNFMYQIPLAPTTARFYGGNYREVRVKFNMPVDNAVAGECMPCGLMLNEHSLKVINEQANSDCSWLDSSTLRVKLSAKSSLKPGDELSFLGDTLHPKSHPGIASPLTLPATRVVIDEDPEYELPEAAIIGPATISNKLAELHLDGSHSMGSGLSYSWGCSVADIDSSLKRLPPSRRHINMPLGVLPHVRKGGKPLLFSLVVADSMGRRSLPQYHKVEFVTNDAPILHIDAPKTISASSMTDIVVNAKAVNHVEGRVLFFWEKINAEPKSSAVQEIFAKGPLLRIPSNSLVSGKHTFRVVGYIEGAPKLAGSSTVMVNIRPEHQDGQQLKTGPEGGSCDVSPASGGSHNTLFTISCADWYDAAEFERGSKSQLRYVFRYRASENRRWNVLQFTGFSPMARDFMLPSGRYPRSGVQLQVQVIGAAGVSTVWEGKVQVEESYPPDVATEEEVVAALRRLGSEGGALQQSVLAGDMSHALNLIDLTAMFSFHPGLEVTTQRRRRLGENEITSSKLLEYLVRLSEDVILDPAYYDQPMITSMVRTLAEIALRTSASGDSLSMNLPDAATGKYAGNRWTNDVGQVLYLALELANANDMNPMPVVIATDLQTIMANVLTDDVMTRGRSATWKTCTGCSSNFTDWLKFTKYQSDAIRNVMRRWSLTTFTPASETIVVNADSPSVFDFFGDYAGKTFVEGTAQFAAKRLYIDNLLLSNTSSFESITIGNATFSVSEKLAEVLPSIVDASAFVFPVFYQRTNSKTFFGYMYGIALSDPAATGALRIADLEHPINMTITLERSVEGWVEGRYAACRYWNETEGEWSESGVRNKAYNWYDEAETGFTEHGPQVVCLMEHLTEFAVENIAAPPTPVPPTPVPTSVPTPWPTVNPLMYPPHWTLGFTKSFVRPQLYALRSEGQNKTLFNEEDPPLDVEQHLLIHAGANESVTSSILTIKEVSNEPSSVYPDREDPEAVRILYEGVVRGAGAGGVTVPLSIEYTIRVAHVGTSFAEDTGYVTNNGGACLARRLVVKSLTENLYPAVPLRIILPHSGAQVVIYPHGSTRTDYLPWADMKPWLTYGEMDLNDGFYVASYTEQPWNVIQHGIQEPYELAGYCTTPEPSLDLLSTCYLNPSSRYGCPFVHPKRVTSYSGWYLPLSHGSSLEGGIPVIPTAAPTKLSDADGE